MRKIFLIGWKDVTLAFRDRAALILMLAAPFLLTLGLGFVTGSFNSGGGGLQSIPLVVVNQDGGQLGDSLVQLLQSSDLAGLVTPTLLSDPAEARRLVDQDKTASAVIIPAGFTGSVIPSAGSAAGPLVKIELYTNPTHPTGSGVIRAILEGYLNQVEVGRVGAQVAVTQLIQAGLIGAQDASRVGAAIGARQAAPGGAAGLTVNSLTASGEAPAPFNALSYMAPGMALMFLMYTVSYGGRTLLAERSQGTLPRLLVAPVSLPQVLAGKVFGIFLTGAAQMLILIVASTLFFQLQWGDPLAVLVLVLAAVVGAVGWGLLITALCKTPGQVAGIGSAVMLTFGILGGSFISLDAMPAWFRILSKITPNAWGLDGFTILASGGRLDAIAAPVAGLLVMGAVLFAAAVLILSRRGIVER